MSRRRTASTLVLALIALACADGCSASGRARDVAGDRRQRGASRDAAALDNADDGGVPEPPRVVAKPTLIGKQPRVFTKASTRVLAQDAVNLYYGDTEDDGVYSMPKAGGNAVKIARHAPVAGAIALEADTVTWIASPGDAVLRASLRGGQPVTLRDHGIFSDVATDGSDVYITEAIGAGGALLKVTGNGPAARVATFDGAPRVVMADATHTYIVTPTKVLRIAHAKPEVETIGTGSGFTFAEMDDAFVYIVAEDRRAGVIVKVAKAGGPLSTIAQNVRNAPLEVAGNDLYFFDANRSQLLVAPTSGGEARLVAEHDGLGAPSAIEADATTLYVATGSHESAVILAIDRK